MTHPDKNNKTNIQKRQTALHNTKQQPSYSDNVAKCLTNMLSQFFHRCKNLKRLLMSTITSLPKVIWEQGRVAANVYRGANCGLYA